MDLDQLVAVSVIRARQFVPDLGAVFPPLHQAPSPLLAGTSVDAMRIVGHLDQRLAESDLRCDPVGVLGSGPVLGGRRQNPDGLAGHHPVTARRGVEVAVEHVDQDRGERQPHADVLDRDEAQASPKVLCDIGRGRVHLVRGEDGVVDPASADLLLEGRDEEVYRDAVRGVDLRVRVLAEVAGSIVACHGSCSFRTT
jgi:hypothetical protein